MIDVAPQSKASAKKAQADLQNSRNCLVEVERELRLVIGKLDETEKHFAGSAKSEEEALSELTEMSSRVLFF